MKKIVGRTFSLYCPKKISKFAYDKEKERKKWVHGVSKVKNFFKFKPDHIASMMESRTVTAATVLSSVQRDMGMEVQNLMSSLMVQLDVSNNSRK